MLERWLAVIGYEGLYEVSDLGRVRSISRRVPCTGGFRMSHGRLLKLSFPGVKYQGVTLFKKGKSRSFSVHRLVLMAFCGKPPANHEACHHNGNCQDNRLANLRWDTRSGNRDDGKRLGEIPLGEERPFSKLTRKDVIAIRVVVNLMGRSRKEMAGKFGISPMTVGKIMRREKWKHVP